VDRREGGETFAGADGVGHDRAVFGATRVAATVQQVMLDVSHCREMREFVEEPHLVFRLHAAVDRVRLRDDHLGHRIVGEAKLVEHTEYRSQPE